MKRLAGLGVVGLLISGSAAWAEEPFLHHLGPSLLGSIPGFGVAKKVHELDLVALLVLHGEIDRSVLLPSPGGWSAG